MMNATDEADAMRVSGTSAAPNRFEPAGTVPAAGELALKAGTAPNPEASGAPNPEASGAPKPEASGASKPEASGAPNPEVKNNDAGGERASSDFEQMTHNAVRMLDAGAKAAAAFLRPQANVAPSDGSGDAGVAMEAISRVAEYWLSDPSRTVAAQAAFASGFIDLWGSTLRRFYGEKVDESVKQDPADKRFAAPEWKEQPFFDFIRQAYGLSTTWANDLVENAQDVDPHTKNKARFYVKQIASALSPSNFLPTNPELLRETVKHKGENLVRGMQALADDLTRGNGQLHLRQSDDSTMELGVNTAMTPGKVVFRNDLIELIQYAPTTPEVRRRPLLIVPPWINKFYVLDLNPQRSFVRWVAAQGTTVFIISWVNPDARHAGKSFEHYMREGILEALGAIEAATGEREVSTLGYCVGGTLLSVTLAYMAARKDTRITDATFLATQVDFTDPGDLKIFVDEQQVRAVEKKMEAKGYLEADSMANAFNMLRPDDLIWPYLVNQYIKGVPPQPFDLLSWNADQTRMPAANHSFYLRNCYLDNTLSQGEMVIAGQKLDLRKITVPVYFLAMREDHIAPARSCFTGAKLFGGAVRFVMSGSGHIAGAVNPPDKGRYPHWVGSPPQGDFDAWKTAAEQRQGSWWPDWHHWLESHANDHVPARIPGSGALEPLCDAPGTYVKVKA